MIKTVAKIQKQFTKMIQDLETIVEREEKAKVLAEQELERAGRESDQAARFRDNLKTLIGE
jgi:hypothetical protein